MVIIVRVDQSSGADMYTSSALALSDMYLFHELYASGEFYILLFGLKTTPETQNTKYLVEDLSLEKLVYFS